MVLLFINVTVVNLGKVIDDDILKDNVKEGADDANDKSYMDLDSSPKLKNSGRNLNETDETKVTEKDSNDLRSANSKLNIENANEVQEEHSKPRHNRDLAFFF